MPNSHYEKWVLKLPVGFLLIGGGIFFMYYSLTHLEALENWIFFGLVSAISVAIGVIVLCTAAINKMKSDLIKRQKLKQLSG